MTISCVRILTSDASDERMLNDPTYVLVIFIIQLLSMIKLFIIHDQIYVPDVYSGQQEAIFTFEYFLIYSANFYKDS